VENERLQIADVALSERCLQIIDRDENSVTPHGLVAGAKVTAWSRN
jgi:hypothetical protein